MSDATLLFEPASRLLQGQGALAGVGLCFVFGLVSCFFGYRALRLVLALLGFIAGVIAGLALAPRLALDLDRSLVSLLAALGGGGLGALLLFGVFHLGMAVLGACAVGALAWAGGLRDTVLLLAVGAVGSLTTLLMQRVLLTALTSVAGGFALVQGVAILLGRPLASVTPAGLPASVPPWPLPALVLWALCAIAGWIVQLNWTAPRPHGS